METVKTLISAEEIKKRVAELGKQISEDYKGKTLTAVCILKGGIIFTADLVRELSGETKLDFMEISSYGDSTVSSGTIKIARDVEYTIEGLDVLVIEDIIDTGRTLSNVMKHLLAQKPNSLRLATLLDKPDRRLVNDCIPDYVGFTIPDHFVVGYGLDYAQRYRNLPYIGILDLG